MTEKDYSAIPLDTTAQIKAEMADVYREARLTGETHIGKDLVAMLESLSKITEMAARQEWIKKLDDAAKQEYERPRLVPRVAER